MLYNDRLTTYVGESAVCCEDIISDSAAMKKVIAKLAAYEDTGWQPNELKLKPQSFVLKVKAVVYVLAKYTKFSLSPEILKCKITRISSSGDLMKIVVTGTWHTGDPYRAVFSASAINTRIFGSMEDAETYVKLHK